MSFANASSLELVVEFCSFPEHGKTKPCLIENHLIQPSWEVWAVYIFETAFCHRHLLKSSKCCSSQTIC